MSATFQGHTIAEWEAQFRETERLHRQPPKQSRRPQGRFTAFAQATSAPTMSDAECEAMLKQVLQGICLSDAELAQRCQTDNPQRPVHQYIRGIRLYMSQNTDDELLRLCASKFPWERTAAGYELKVRSDRQAASLGQSSLAAGAPLAGATLTTPADFQAMCQRESGRDGHALREYTDRRAKEWAATEWDTIPVARNGFSSRGNYILGRSAELNGSFRKYDAKTAVVQTFAARA